MYTPNAILLLVAAVFCLCAGCAHNRAEHDDYWSRYYGDEKRYFASENRGGGFHASDSRGGEFNNYPARRR